MRAALLVLGRAVVRARAMPEHPVRYADLRCAVGPHRDPVRTGERPEVVIEGAILLHDDDDVIDRPGRTGRDGGSTDCARAGVVRRRGVRREGARGGNDAEQDDRQQGANRSHPCRREFPSPKHARTIPSGRGRRYPHWPSVGRLGFGGYGVWMDDVGSLSGIVLECRDPTELARFYSALTGWPLVFTDDDFAAIGEGPEAAFHLGFQRAPAHEPPTWPDPRSSMQSHLHIKVRDLDAAERRVLELGGTRFSTQPAPDASSRPRRPRGPPLLPRPARVTTLAVSSGRRHTGRSHRRSSRLRS